MALRILVARELDMYRELCHDGLWLFQGRRQGWQGLKLFKFGEVGQGGGNCCQQTYGALAFGASAAVAQTSYYQQA